MCARSRLPSVSRASRSEGGRNEHINNARAEPKPNSVRLRAAPAVGAVMISFTPTLRYLAAALVSLVLIAAPAAAASSNADPKSCPGGFPYVMTLPDALVHYAGYYTVEEILTGFASHDVNGNGFWCYQASPNRDERYFPLLNFRDDLGGRGIH